MPLTFSSQRLLTEVEEGRAGAAVAERISWGHPVPELSEAESNAGTPALGVEKFMSWNGIVGFHHLKVLYKHSATKKMKDPRPEHFFMVMSSTSYSSSFQQLH